MDPISFSLPKRRQIATIQIRAKDWYTGLTGPVSRWQVEMWREDAGGNVA
jgi:hypothetical protein